MTTFVALGDSITVGMGDPAPDGAGWRGWAALLGASLPQPVMHNLATLGALAATSSGSSCPRPWPSSPTWPAWWWASTTPCGPTSTRERTGPAVARTVEGLRSAGAQVLTMRLPDPGQMFGLPTPLARPLTQAGARGQRRAGRRGPALRHGAPGRGPGPGHLRAPVLERGPAASERARAPLHGLPVPRPAGRGGRPGRARARPGAVHPAAVPVGGDPLDGDQGHDMAGAAGPGTWCRPCWPWPSGSGSPQARTTWPRRTCSLCRRRPQPERPQETFRKHAAWPRTPLGFPQGARPNIRM